MTERLPLLVEYAEDETLISKLTLVAFELGATRDELARSLDLGPRFVDPRRRLKHLTSESLDAPEVDSLAIAFDLSPQRIVASTVTALHDRALHVGVQAKSVSRHTMWAQITRARACTDCLAETHGARTLITRTPWAFACTRHRRILIDTCPWCLRSIPVTSDLVSGVLTPQSCGARSKDGRKFRFCDFDLTLAAGELLPASHPILNTQKYLQQLIQGPTENADVRDVLNDMRAISVGLLAAFSSDEIAARAQLEPGPLRGLWYRPERLGTAPPDDSLFTAALVTAADQILRNKDRSHRRALLEPVFWANVSRISERTPSARINVWGPHSRAFEMLSLQILDRDLGLLDRVRYRSTSARPSTPDDRSASRARARARRIPQQFWPEITFLLADRTDTEGDKLRSVLSAALVGVGDTERSQTALFSRLGWDGNHPELRSQLLGDEARQEATLLILCSLADSFDGRLGANGYDRRDYIDYDRRRGLDFSNALPEALWIQFCVVADIHPGTGAKWRAAHLFLARRVSGSLNPSGAPTTSDVSSHQYTQFLLDNTAALLDVLDAHASSLLRRAGIHHEPVTMSPRHDVEVLPGLLATRMADTATATLTAALDGGVRKMEDLTQASVLTRLQIRLIMESHPPGQRLRIMPQSLHRRGDKGSLQFKPDL